MMRIIKNPLSAFVSLTVAAIALLGLSISLQSIVGELPLVSRVTLIILATVISLVGVSRLRKIR